MIARTFLFRGRDFDIELPGKLVTEVLLSPDILTLFEIVCMSGLINV